MRVPSITIDVLAAVIAVAERRSFDRAAQDLALTKSAVQKRVRIAERLMGQRLFVGPAQGKSLTEAGRVFHTEAARTVQHAFLTEEKTRSYAHLSEGQLQVGHSTYLPPKLLAFVMKLKPSRQPATQIRHVPGISGALAQKVVEGSLHIAFGDLPVSHQELQSHQILEEPLVVCLSKSHPLAARPFIRPEDLDGLPFIAVSRDSLPAQHLEIEGYFRDFGARLNVTLDAFGPPEALNMVEHNMGVCLVSSSAAQGSSIVARPLSVKTLTRKMGFYIREDNRHPLLLEFVNLILQETAPRDTEKRPSGRARHS